MNSLELGNLRWRKSTRSNNGGANCVEVAAAESVVAVRDSKDREGPVLTTSPSDWLNFTAAIEAGHFDL